MRRFFIPRESIQDNTAFVTGSDVHHIINVLRKNVGDDLPATDGYGNLLNTRISSIEGEMIHLEILESAPAEGRKIFVRLFQAMPRGNKFDSIVEKACELGVNELVPVVTERSPSKLCFERGLKKIARWEKIALETMKQVGRATQMSIKPAIDFDGIQKMLKAFSLKILPWELEEERTLKSLLKAQENVSDIEVLIGSEGGFSVMEIEELSAYGFQSVSLGKLILKAETAVAATLANIYYELE
jgi:16S rRNA (uracil1498-N3)-methyltransferase